MTKINLTVDCSKLTSVRPSILTEKDKKSFTDLACEMTKASTAQEVLDIAHQIVNCDKRNKRIDENEKNIHRIIEYIKENTVSGDIISKRCMKLIVRFNWSELDVNLNAARYKAVEEAFKRLVNCGELIPTRMRTKEKTGRYDPCYIYSTLYIVA